MAQRTKKKPIGKRRQRLLDKYLLDLAELGTLGADVLVKEGANIETRDERNWTPLMVAAREGHTGLCGLLLGMGADINAEDETGWTPFKLARFNRHGETKSFLVLHRLLETQEEINAFAAHFESCIA